ncbi:MAG: helix-turn-helix domain-containing protein [Magnetococcales bacterium]|nr:helix-turn-helix domain-containing protein [Magnetococcales bacterium]
MNAQAADFGQFAQIPIGALLDQRLAASGFRVLTALFSFASRERPVCWPSRATLAERAGVSLARVSVITRQLEELGWLKRESGGGRSTSRYHMRVPPHLRVAFKNDQAPQSPGIAQPDRGGLPEQTKRTEEKNKPHQRPARKLEPVKTKPAPPDGGGCADLIFPGRLSGEEQKVISHYLAGHQPDMAQTILDELTGRLEAAEAGTTKPVESPSGYARKLATLAAKGEFLPERALGVAERRKAAQDARLAREKEAREQRERNEYFANRSQEEVAAMIAKGRALRARLGG